MIAKMELRNTLCLFLLFLSTVTVSNAYRILVVFPTYSKSHNILGQGVVTNLLAAGHEVVFLTSFPREKPVQNLTEIDCKESVAEIMNEADKKSPTCDNCGLREDVYHILVECTRNETQREWWFQDELYQIGFCNCILASPTFDRAITLYKLAELGLNRPYSSIQ